jgi:signal transduction histidine kinase
VTDTGRVLVVDDTEANRVLLQEILELEGYQVLNAADGAAALQAISREQPDLVLLDVNMPGLDGLEVCRRLRADPATEALPVILVTALAERTHRLEGISAGANDYLTKPIDRPDLLLRLRNALRLRKLHQEIATQYDKLRELEQLRDGLVHMLVHDLRTPLTGITVYLQMAQERLAQLGDHDLTENLEAMGDSVARLTDMVSDVLDVSRLEANAMPLKLAEVDLRELATEAVQSLRGWGGHAKVVQCNGNDPAPATVDAGLIRRVIANLVGNALKFSPRGSDVRLEVCRSSAAAEIRVSDRGPGIPPECHQRIFEKFGQTNGAQATIRSSGLGLTFCKLAVEAHGGTIGVASEVGVGSTFSVRLPDITPRGAPPPVPPAPPAEPVSSSQPGSPAPGTPASIRR